MSRIAIVEKNGSFLIRKGWIFYSWLDTNWKGGYWWDDGIERRKSFATRFTSINSAEIAYKKYNSKGQVRKWL